MMKINYGWTKFAQLLSNIQTEMLQCVLNTVFCSGVFNKIIFICFRKLSSRVTDYFCEGGTVENLVNSNGNLIVCNFLNDLTVINRKFEFVDQVCCS